MLRIEADGVPDRETYGDTDMSVDWYVDAGNGLPYNGGDKTLRKSFSNDSSRWYAFINQVTVFPGQTYRLSYDSIEQLDGDPRDIKIRLYEWTDAPSSNLVMVLGTVPYSDKPGDIDIAIPSNLKSGRNYSVVIAAGFSELTDYEGIMRKASFSCITKGGYIYISSGPTFDSSKYSGHSVVAVAMPRNDYFTMSRVVTDPVAVG